MGSQRKAPRQNRQPKRGRSKAGAGVEARATPTIVGIGASVGGLEALEQFFEVMPDDSGLAFVIVQPLSPDSCSMMDELLSRRSRMKILQAGEGMVVEPDSIYLNPSRRTLCIDGGRLSLKAARVKQVSKHPIDAFFTSLARDRGANAVGIILSGTGDDGTSGAAAILDAGGVVIVQDPEAAQFDSMPRAAIDTGLATAICAPSEMPTILAGLSSGSSPLKSRGNADASPEQEILRLLDKRFGANFASYKQSTVLRLLPGTTRPVVRSDRRPLLFAYDAIVARYAPPGVLIAQSGELVHVFGDVQRFLRLKSGAYSCRIEDIVIDALKLAVNESLEEARKSGGASRVRQVRFTKGGVSHLAQVTCETVTSGGEAPYYLLAFEEITDRKPILPDTDEVISTDERQALQGRIGELERCLRFTEESLRTTIEELEASNEELRSTNEELRAVNEELYSISGEHQRKIAELTAVTNDMEDLLRCADVGTLFLDNELRVRRFTPAVALSFNLLERGIGRPVGHITARFSYPELEKDAARVAATGEALDITVDVNDVTLLLRMFPFKAGKLTNGIVITLVDVTKLKRAERGLESKNKELARLIASLQQFNYIVSHDLRAPLRTIANSAKWIEEDLNGTASLEVREHCDRLVSHVRRLTQMLDDLREYARLEIGDNKLETIDIDALLEQIVETVDSDGRLIVTVESKLGAFLAYKAPLLLVFQNLFDNALKHANAEKTNVEVVATKLDGHASFSVRDDGPGIPIRYQEKIFLPFRKLERAIETDGTGMGLALVKKAIEDNGGTIEVLSDPDERPGTEFRFTWALPNRARAMANDSPDGPEVD